VTSPLSAHGGMSFRQANKLQEECAMKKLILLAAAAAFLAPAMISSAGAETVNVRIGTPAYRAQAQERVVVRSGSDCRMVTTKIKQRGKTIIKKVRKCG